MILTSTSKTDGQLKEMLDFMKHSISNVGLIRGATVGITIEFNKITFERVGKASPIWDYYKQRINLILNSENALYCESSDYIYDEGKDRSKYVFIFNQDVTKLLD